MSSVDLRRVQEARRRLQSADATSRTEDSAIRIVELYSPRHGEGSLALDPAFCVIFGLSGAPRQALAATVDAVRSNNKNMGLSGRVESFGRRYAMHQSSVSPPRTPGTSVVPAAAIFSRTTARTAEAAQLAEVIDTISNAALLTGAELRGADAAAADLDAQLVVAQAAGDQRAAPTDRTSIEAYDEQRHSDDAQVLAALDSVAPPDAALDQISLALGELRDDPRRTALEAACSQATAAKGQLQPSDANDVVMLANLAVAEADGCLAEYDMMPGAPAATLVELLREIGLAAEPFEAPGLADRVLGEAAELDAIRDRLTRAIERETASPEVARLSDDRRTLDERRLQIQRRLRSQQQLLAVAREESTRLGIDLDGSRSFIDLGSDDDRRLPILIEEPLADLPARLSGAVLGTLLRHSARTQVICVSNQLDLREWCESVGDRAGWVAASGWFSGVASTNRSS